MLIALMGWFGAAALKESSDSVGEYMSKGGNFKRGVQEGSRMLAKSLLATTSFSSAYIVCVLSSILSIARKPEIAGYYVFTATISSVMAIIFLKLILGRRVFELELLRINGEIPIAGPIVLNQTRADIINIMTAVLFALSLIASVIEIVVVDQPSVVDGEMNEMGG